MRLRLLRLIMPACAGGPRSAGAQVCANFIPCMHNFFLENFRQPGIWFEKRLTYTRATAVNSMAGYLIGLGDRHSQNILVDRKSAEVSSSCATQTFMMVHKSVRACSDGVYVLLVIACLHIMQSV